MSEEIKPIEEASANPSDDESRIAGVSVRGWIAIILVSTVCIMSGAKIEVKEPLYTLVGMVIGFYYGKNKKQ